MDIIIILQIITIVVSIIALLINSYITVETNKANQISEVVAKQRITFLEKIRSSYAKINTICNPIILKNSNKNKIVKEIIFEISSLSILFRKNFDIDKRLVDKLDAIQEASFQYIEVQNDVNSATLLELLKEFSGMVTLYDLAYWQYIINQANGRNYDGESFDDIYDSMDAHLK